VGVAVVVDTIITRQKSRTSTRTPVGVAVVAVNTTTQVAPSAEKGAVVAPVKVNQSKTEAAGVVVGTVKRPTQPSTRVAGAVVGADTIRS
jgi:hypothetical protein